MVDEDSQGDWLVKSGVYIVNDLSPDTASDRRMSMRSVYGTIILVRVCPTQSTERAMSNISRASKQR